MPGSAGMLATEKTPSTAGMTATAETPATAGVPLTSACSTCQREKV